MFSQLSQDSLDNELGTAVDGFGPASKSPLALNVVALL